MCDQVMISTLNINVAMLLATNLELVSNCLNVFVGIFWKRSLTALSTYINFLISLSTDKNRDNSRAKASRQDFLPIKKGTVPFFLIRLLLNYYNDLFFSPQPVHRFYQEKYDKCNDDKINDGSYKAAPG
jgi:predicted metal-dependent hydrolase